MSTQRMIFVRRALQVRAFISGVDDRYYEWKNLAEPIDIYVACTTEWYGPRDWSPRKHKRGDTVLGELRDSDQIKIIVVEEGEPERIWYIDPFWVEGALVVIPVLQATVF